MKKEKTIRVLLFAFYGLVCLYVLYKNTFLLRFSFLFPLLVPLFLLTVPKKALLAVRDWVPFYLVIFFYDTFRALIPELTGRLDLYTLANWEVKIFGEPIPTIYIQDKLAGGLESTLGAVLTIFYLTHFILPVLVLYFLWRKNRKHYFFAVSCLLLVSFLAFFTFLVFPASPPWHASLLEVIPETKQYLLINLDKMFHSSYLLDLERSLNSNPFAPFPSLHAAYPLLLFLFSLKFFKKYSLPFLLIALVVPFALVAFGEHYVVDIIAGWAYATTAYFVVKKVAPGLN